jgi:penicillin amidase
MPGPGWDDRYGWEGFVPFGELPHALNPPQGRLVTANNKPAPDGGPFLGADWLPGYRALRIERMLQAKRRFTVEDHIRATEGVECRKDAEVIAAANEHGIAMVFTGHRHFRH